ncbi:MAG: hypothetical protein IH609_14865 [Dehalococcoidia bacterium]|nr:hypothetical protein [Dehalococcoidia bacterium]
MSRRAPGSAGAQLTSPAVIFGAAILVLCATWFFGIATRVSINNDIDIVARAGIFRVLTAGISDLVDTFLLIALATAAYLVSLWALRRGFRHGFTAAIAGTVLACLSMLPAMPLTSPDAVHLAADVRTFWLHGKWPADGENAPATIDDPVANEVRVFRNQPSGYGPLAYAIGGAPLPFVGDGFRANLLGQKVVAGIFLTLTAAAAGLIARRLGQNAGLVAGMIGLNPMMTWQFPGDGHNDTIMAFFGVVAIGLVIQPGWRERGAGVASGLAAALCKYGLLLASPIVAAWWFPRWRNALAALAAIGGAAVLFLYIIDAGPVNNGTLGPAGAVARTTPWGVLASITDAGSAGEDRMVVAGYVLFLMTLAVIMLWHPLETQVDLIRAVALAMGLFLYLCAPGYLAWYLIWFLPFAAMSGSRWLMSGALAFTITAFLPILALNWGASIRASWSIGNPVEWAVVVAWLSTAAAAYLGTSRRQRPHSSRRQKTTGPRFAPRQKRRATN